MNVVSACAMRQIDLPVAGAAMSGLPNGTLIEPLSGAMKAMSSSRTITLLPVSHDPSVPSLGSTARMRTATGPPPVAEAVSEVNAIVFVVGPAMTILSSALLPARPKRANGVSSMPC